MTLKQYLRCGFQPAESNMATATHCLMSMDTFQVVILVGSMWKLVLVSELLRPDC